MEDCIHPLDADSHNENSLCKIYTGEIAAADANVNKAFENDRNQLKGFKESLPEVFRSTIKNLLYLLDPKTSEGAKLQMKKVTTLSCCLHVLFISAVLLKLNLKNFLIFN